MCYVLCVICYVLCVMCYLLCLCVMFMCYYYSVIKRGAIFMDINS